MQIELRMSEEQQQSVLEVRSGVISWLEKSQELRVQAYAQLGSDVITLAQVHQLSQVQSCAGIAVMMRFSCTSAYGSGKGLQNHTLALVFLSQGRMVPADSAC